MSVNGTHAIDDPEWNRTRHPDEETLAAYLDRELSAPVRSSVAAHLVACADCRRTLSELRAVSLILRATTQVEPPRSFRLTPEMIAARRPPLLRLMPHLRALTAVAAVLLVLSFTPDLIARSVAPATVSPASAEAIANRQRAADASLPPSPVATTAAASSDAANDAKSTASGSTATVAAKPAAAPAAAGASRAVASPASAATEADRAITKPASAAGAPAPAAAPTSGVAAVTSVPNVAPTPVAPLRATPSARADEATPALPSERVAPLWRWLQGALALLLAGLLVALVLVPRLPERRRV